MGCGSSHEPAGRVRTYQRQVTQLRHIGYRIETPTMGAHPLEPSRLILFNQIVHYSRDVRQSVIAMLGISEDEGLL